ncbi:MAG: diguanylate cyclase [Sedimentisphaerales bacterium]|nr:diguanylate cyclase [Sedimentisphaerales bacterium]
MRNQSETISDSGPTRTESILLLGDDGSLAAMLRERLGGFSLRCVDNALDGIIKLGETPAEIILLNAARLGNRTAEAVRALRRVCRSARIFTYGEPYCENHARSGLKAGADDYFIWPISSGQLLKLFRADVSGARVDSARDGAVLRRTSDAESADCVVAEAIDGRMSRLLGKYHELARLIPRGKAVLLEQGRMILAEALGLERMQILSGDSIENPMPDSPGCMVILQGPAGVEGKMILGPREKLDEATLAMARQAGEFIGTFLYLARRDESLKQLAIVDELTGAYNRRYLEYFMRQIIEQSHHRHTDVTLLIFDIDEFKHFNDTYGHNAGDEILFQATRLMQRCCRTHDVVARIGGDEFAVLFWDSGQSRQRYKSPRKNSTVPTAVKLAQFIETPTEDSTPATNEKPPRSHPELAMFLSNRFRRILRASDFSSLGPEARGKLTISGGVASFPWDGNTAEELMFKADEALLSAKRSGKNRIYLVGRPETG